MASTVKVPLLGTHSKGTVIGVSLGGITVAVYLIHRQMKKAKETQAAASQAAQAAAGYGYGTGAYGYGSNYPMGYYGYGNGFGTTGFMGSNVGPDVDTDTDTDTDTDEDDKKKIDTHDKRVRVPSVIGLTETRADSRLGSAGFHKIKAQGHGHKVKGQRPHAGVKVDPDSTQILLQLGR
jgi:hypothetical protein